MMNMLAKVSETSIPSRMGLVSRIIIILYWIIVITSAHILTLVGR